MKTKETMYKCVGCCELKKFSAGHYNGICPSCYDKGKKALGITNVGIADYYKIKAYLTGNLK